MLHALAAGHNERIKARTFSRIGLPQPLCHFPKTSQELLDFQYFIWYSTFWVKVRVFSDCGSFSAAFLISGNRKFQPPFLTPVRFYRGAQCGHFWSAAACRRFSVVKSAPPQSSRSPGAWQEKHLRLDSYVNL
jgi:hypothetical protein